MILLFLRGWIFPQNVYREKLRLPTVRQVVGKVFLFCCELEHGSNTVGKSEQAFRGLRAQESPGLALVAV